MGRLDRLPTELVIKIANSAPDLVTLHHLTVASTRISEIFDQIGMEILESVMDNDTPPEIRYLVRLMAKVHACTPEAPMASTCKGFLDRYVASIYGTCLEYSIHGTLAEFDPFVGTPLTEIGRVSAYSPYRFNL
ncbi:acetamidase [Metarhizium robertsii ARSEF 23]|uniref:Acetamidase n=1 Tax=Metarhizium robertsii (strain ARSEF 23 / ATCC MYA-3075) TaxID=655844 RepID=E9ENW8_METRA|nr:acetamidase [Metarhizium robertsii ARSEF 23]EFZ02395.2 acetamidase [Metarhizium robertsii ARSEF 23]